MGRRRITAGLTAAVIGIFTLLPFLGYSPNRVAEGVPVYIWEIHPALLLLPVGLAVLTLLSARPGLLWLELYIPALISAGALMVLSLSSGHIPPAEAATARMGGSWGLWGWMLTGYIYGSSLKRSSSSLMMVLGVALFFLLSGALDVFGPIREFAVKEERFFSEVRAHLSLAGSATLIAALVAVPAGIAAHRLPAFSRPAFAGANIIQTLPSLALFGLMIAPLSWLSMRFPLLREMGIKGVGNFPALIALSGYAALPILRNTYTGLKVIPAGAVQAGRGMGMSPLRLLALVELPLALPVLLGGLRIAFVQAIGNTTVAALIGAGGLGYFVFQGLGQAAPDLILLGVVPLIAITVAADKGLKLLEYLLTPKPFRRENDTL
ncbi:ABC transporter permease [Marispirochaeta aestuarii]|uniref:ABC transporter permease n=1 Tax=Marispirochaeta aestuarii TaxID=1963862 RepID=UPI002ABD23FF|nr:ABC transporter permease [Marispirochaeta aestuarii]